MIAKSKCVSIELVAVFAYLILSTTSTVPWADEPAGNKIKEVRKDEQPPETKQIDLGDGLVLKEYREFKNGKVAVLIKTYERNGETIMRHISMPGAENDMRTFFRDGKEILSEEIDEKGHVVRIVVSRDDGSWHELFEQQDDGAIVPIGTKRLQQVRKHTEFMKKSFTPIVEAVKDGDKDKANKRLDSMIEKIKAGEFNSDDEQNAETN